MEQKIIFSKQIMLGLLEKGFRPIESFPNPTNPKYLAWAFEKSDALERAFAEVVSKRGQ